MNETHESDDVPPPIRPFAPGPPPTEPFSHWIKRLFACNPFYLLSAVLLLFGCYQVSEDPAFLSDEVAQLGFNFVSLQTYEVLVVVTAIFLARRRIWYDSTLLVVLESLLLFVPFILLSQAALIDARLVRVMCLAGATIAVMRFGGLKRHFVELNLPVRVLVLGAVLLVVNVVLPLVYREVNDSKLGIKPAPGPAYALNEWTWLVILPAALALANFLPRAREVGSLLPQRRWLPAGMFSLWLAGTAVHVYCLRYVYDFDMRRELVAPALWVLAWTAWLRLPRVFEFRPPELKNALLILPLVPAFGAWENHNHVFVVLTTLNAAFYAVCWFKNRNPLAQHLLFASLVMVIAGVPYEWVRWMGPRLDRSSYVAAAIAVYLVLCSALSRNPKLGILGALAMGASVLMFFGQQVTVVHWAMQSMLVFFLLHSLRWEDLEHQGATIVRHLAATAWVIHSAMWMHAEDRLWAACIPGTIVLAVYLVAQFFRGRWDRLVLPVAALPVILSGPGNALIQALRSTSAGLLAVIGSFVLFAAGTAVALTRHRWNRSI